MKRLHHKGFTLIELILTIVVVGVIAVPLALVVGEHVVNLFYSEDVTITRELARFEMEKVNNLDYNNITDNNISDYEGYSYDVSRKVIYEEGGSGTDESLKRVTVKVFKAGTDQSVDSPLVICITFIAKNIE